MITASHNSATYLPAVGLLAPFAFLARCQQATIFEQYAAGCRLFDFRITFDRAGNDWFAHGLIRYCRNRLSPREALSSLNILATADNVDLWVRIVYERGSDRKLFSKFCQTIETAYPRLHFCGGVDKKDWRPIYGFAEPAPEITDAYASFHDGESHPLTGLFPRLWARRHNAARRAAADPASQAYLMQDFLTVY